MEVEVEAAESLNDRYVCPEPRLGVCKMALLAIALVDGTITFDTTTWADVVASGELLFHQCVEFQEMEGGIHIPSGGHVVTGLSFTHFLSRRCFTLLHAALQLAKLFPLTD